MYSSEERAKAQELHYFMYETMCNLLGRNLPWSPEWIKETSLVVVDIAARHFGVDAESLYPYAREEQWNISQD